MKTDNKEVETAEKTQFDNDHEELKAAVNEVINECPDEVIEAVLSDILTDLKENPGT